jgi:hypothetical protein
MSLYKDFTTVELNPHPPCGVPTGVKAACVSPLGKNFRGGDP